MQELLTADRPLHQLKVKDTFIFGILLLAVIAFPIVRVAGVPLPLILLASGLLLFAGRIQIGPRFIWAICGMAALYLLCAAYANSRYDLSYGFKDLLYFVVPVQFYLGFVLFNTILARKPALRQTMGKFLAVFLLVQLGAVAIELAHFTPLISVMKPYIAWFLLNTSSTAEQLNYISLRPSGTVGNPVILGVLSWMLSRFLSYWYKKPIFIVLGLMLVLLSAARMAMVGIIFGEAIAFFVAPQFKFRLTKKSLTLTLIGVAALIGAAVFMFMAVPFMREYLSVLSSGSLDKLSGDYSVTYRAQIYAWAIQHPHYLLFGGLSLAKAPESVDSEILMRSLQLGIFGFLCLQVPLVTILLCGIRKRSRELVRFGVGLYCFALICSITFSPFSDPYFVIWYSLIAALCWNGFEHADGGDKRPLANEST